MDWFGQLTLVGEACGFTRKRGSIEPFYRFGDPLSAQQSEIDCVDERMHVGFGKKWLPVMAKLAGEDKSLTELKQLMREKSILGGFLPRGYTGEAGNVDEMTEEEKLEIAHVASAFCNAIEFTLDFTVY